jgi:hypothetical protein
MMKMMMTTTMMMMMITTMMMMMKIMMTTTMMMLMWYKGSETELTCGVGGTFTAPRESMRLSTDTDTSSDTTDVSTF